MKRAVLMLAIAATLACGREPQRQPADAPRRGPIMSPDQIPRREVPEDVANLAHGSTVVDRTGELSLGASPFAAIDSDIYTNWVSPPQDLVQSATIALGVRTRIERVGFDYAMEPLPPAAVRKMRFESSVDGKTFTPLVTMNSREDAARQWIPVPPTEATYIRVTMEETFGDKASSVVAEIMAAGTELAEWRRPDINGQWKLNNLRASFVEKAGQVFGKIEMDPPMLLEGGWEGRILRFSWLRANNQWGYGLLTVTPDGKSLNGTYWHESPISPFQGPAWFGEKTGMDAMVPTDGVLEGWLTKYGRAPLYALSFKGDDLDGADSGPTLDRIARIVAAHPTAKFALAGYEVRETDAARASARAKKRVDTLLAALKARGVDVARIESRVVGNDKSLIQNDDMQRVIHSRIDLERK